MAKFYFSIRNMVTDLVREGISAEYVPSLWIGLIIFVYNFMRYLLLSQDLHVYTECHADAYV